MLFFWVFAALSVAGALAIVWGIYLVSAAGCSRSRRCHLPAARWSDFGKRGLAPRLAGCGPPEQGAPPPRTGTRHLL
jgi:hypothetical protein